MNSVFILLAILAPILLAVVTVAVVFIFLSVSILGGRGAIYVPTGSEKINKMIKLARAGPGKKAVDLGSGDGRIVIALARAGAEAHGYEVNPLLVRISRKKIREAGLSEKAFIHWKSFWGQDLSGFDVVTLFGATYVMRRLEKKLKKELRPKAKVASYVFRFPHWTPVLREKSVYLYEKN